MKALVKPLRFWNTRRTDYKLAVLMVIYTLTFILFTIAFVVVLWRVFTKKYLVEFNGELIFFTLLAIFIGFLFSGYFLFVKRSLKVYLFILLIFGFLAILGITSWGVLHSYSLLLILICLQICFIWLPFNKALFASGTLLFLLVLLGALELKSIIKYDFITSSLRFQSEDLILLTLLLGVILFITAIYHYSQSRAYLRISNLNQKVIAQNMNLKRQLILKINELFIKDEKINKYEDLDMAYSNVIENVNSRLDAQNRLEYQNSLLLSRMHELNTPIMELMNLAEQMEGENSHKLKKFTDKLKSQVHETREAYHATKQVKLINLYRLAAQLKPISKTDIEYINNIDPTLSITGDQESLTLVLNNLIDNSIYALENSPHEKFIKFKSVVKEKTIELILEDSGKGIEPQVQNQLFELGATSKKGGSGVGLFISREIMRKQFSGELELIASKAGRTSFKLTLPQNGVL